MSKLKALLLSFVLLGALIPAYAQQSAQAQITIVVKPAPISFAAQTFNAQVGVPFVGQLVASGGVAPYSFSLVTSPNPLPWLAISSTGQMSGTPTAATASSGLALLVKVTDASGTTALMRIPLSSNRR